MVLGESQDCSWVAKGWDAMSFFVCFLYAFKAAEMIVSKFVEDVEVDGTWDMVESKELVGCLGENKKVSGKGHKGADSDSVPVNYAEYDGQQPRATHTITTVNPRRKYMTPRLVLPSRTGASTKIGPPSRGTCPGTRYQ